MVNCEENLMKSDQKIAQAVQLLTGRRVRIRLSGTDATPVRARRDADGTLIIRLHPCFDLASEETVRDLAHHMMKPAPETAERIREFVRHARLEVPAKPRRRPPMRPVGEHFDLRKIFAELNERHFEGKLKTGITWGRAATPRRKKRRSMTFGSYEANIDTIRIHPDLDSRKTPRVFLEYIVYHEMLHVIHPTQVHPSGRRTVHTAAFKRDERRFPHLAEAMRYLEKWRGA